MTTTIDFDAPNTKPGYCPECGIYTNCWNANKNCWSCTYCNWTGQFPDPQPHYTNDWIKDSWKQLEQR